MKSVLKIGAIFSLILLLFSFPLFLPHKVPAQSPLEFERLIIKFRPITPYFYRDRLVSSYSGLNSEPLRLKDTLVVRVPASQLEGIAVNLRKNLFVEYAEADFRAEAQDIPNDPQFSNQWGLTKINAPGGWDVTHGGSVDIAILDTGINSAHPDLSAKIIVSVNCTAASTCPAQTTTDPDGHGTHVAGIASAVTNNSIGIAGVSWDARLMSVKVLDDSGGGFYSWISNGIVWAADNGAEVINLSLGGSFSSSTLESAVNYAWGKGVVVVAAAGNSGRNRPLYPAYYTNAIAVGATDASDKKASFSNYGTWVDVAAPGVSILSTYGNGYSTLSGTSMATPFVSGLAGLLFGQNPGWSGSQVRGKIESTADSITGTGTLFKWGRINVCSAVGCVGVPPTLTPTPTPTPTTSPTPTPTPTGAPSPTATPTPTLTPTPAPSLTPTPTPSLPWWCKYIPDHYTCQP